MSQPDSIPVSAEKVAARAYQRIADLTMQLDQLSILYEEALAVARAAASAPATTVEPAPAPGGP